MTPPVMPYIHLPQKERKNPIQQPKPLNEQQKSHEVRQDERGVHTARLASAQAARFGTTDRVVAMDTKAPRSQNIAMHPRIVQVTCYVTHPISSQINRRAADFSITRSKAASDLIERGLLQDIFRDYEQLIIQTIRETITREVRKGIKPLRDNSYRSAFYSAQNRTLLTNILHLFVKLVQEDPETTQEIFRQSEEEARDLLTFLSPQLADLIKKHEYGTREAEREG